MKPKIRYTNYHATLFMPPEVASVIESLRHAWDPIMAAQIAAHVTLAYPQEAPNRDLLMSRLRTACTRAVPFRLRLGGTAYFGRPEDDIYIAVEDVDGGYQDLHEDILRPPFNSVKFPPHVTLIHPRTSSLGRDYWEKSRYQVSEAEFTVCEVTVTAFDGTKWSILETFLLE